jgi:hypothetical protein
MPEHATERVRFTELRARALTNVLLSGREDLLVQDLSGVDYGIDYLVTQRSEKPGLRQFAVELRATHAPVTADTANRVLKPALQGMARYGPFPYPTVLFYFTMMESQGWYTWVSEPVNHEDGTMSLEMQEEADCRPLNESALDQIIACVNGWYDFSFGTKPGSRVTRPGRATKGGVKPVKSDVVITEIDSVTFDYSEALLKTREQLTAAKQCSNYIVKTYPTPLRTLTGLWDREEDEKGRAAITLTVMDAVTKKSATAHFTPKDIQSPAHVYQRFHNLLGEVLHPG